MTEGICYVDPDLAKKLYKINIYSTNVDEVIDLLRSNYSIIIYNSAPPHVESLTEERNIIFSYTVKKCYPKVKDGWNYRKYIYTTKWSPNPWEVKTEAIKAAIEYVESGTVSDS